MRVLMCGNHPSNRGGMTGVIDRIRSHDWKKDGVELSFIPTYMPGGRLKTAAYFLYALCRVFLTFLFRKPDVLYTHMSVRGSFARTRILHRLCGLFDVPDVIHLHGSEFEAWYGSVSDAKKAEIRRLISECGAFVVLGTKWESFVSSLVPEAKIVKIPNAVKIPEERAVWNDRPRFLFLGVLIPRKGVMDLLRAVSKLMDEDRLGGCVFAVAGEGEELEKLRRYAEDAGIADTVEFTGWVSGKAKDEQLLKSQVLVLPSWHEGLPLAVLEAMSYGLPVLATKVGDVPDAVEDGVNGFLFEPGDVNALADGIRRIADRDVWEKMSEQSRKLAEEKFNEDGFFGSLLALWKDAEGRKA